MEHHKDTKIKLGYWPIRGRAHVSRLLLEYTQMNWEDVKYPDADKWFHGDKENLKLEFPNLPYLIDGDLKLTESSAIERYIIEKSGDKQLLGKDLIDRAKVNMLMGVMNDIRQQYSVLLMDKEYKEKLSVVWQNIKPKLQYLQNYIQQKQFALGYLTLFDFFAAECSYYISTIYPDHYKEFSFLQRSRQTINNLNSIKSYYSSHKAIKWPFVTPSMAAVQVKNDD